METFSASGRIIFLFRDKRALRVSLLCPRRVFLPDLLIANKIKSSLPGPTNVLFLAYFVEKTVCVCVGGGGVRIFWFFLCRACIVVIRRRRWKGGGRAGLFREPSTCPVLFSLYSPRSYLLQSGQKTTARVRYKKWAKNNVFRVMLFSIPPNPTLVFCRPSVL